MALSDGNGWLECACGSRHWGRFGAAGLLLVCAPPLEARGDAVSLGAALPGDAVVLLQHRAAWSHQGGTWGVPGGARDSHEDVVTTALRETLEETGIDASAATMQGVHLTDHGPWRYSTVIMSMDHQPTPRGNRESEELRWVRVADVADLPLHPGFAQAWPELCGPRARLVVDVPEVVAHWPGAWGREPALAAQRLIDALRPLVGRARTAADALIILAAPIVAGPASLASSADPAVLVTAANGAGGVPGHIAATAGPGDLVVSADEALVQRVLDRGGAVAHPDWLFAAMGGA